MRLILRCLLLVQLQLLLQVTCVLDKGPCPECGDGWVRVKGDRFCYLHTSANKDFAEWLTYCHEKGATLPILKTQQDRDNFGSLNQPSSGQVYIGLNRSSTTWMWLDDDECTLDDLESIITPEDFQKFSDNRLNDYLMVGFGGSQLEFKLMQNNYLDDVQCQKQCPNTTSGTGSSDLGLGVIIVIAAGGGLLLLLLIVAAVVLVKRKRAAPSQKVEQSATVTAKDDPGAGIATKDLFCGTEADQTGIGTKDLFCGTEADQTGIGTKELFNATEADNASNASLHLQSVEK